MRASISHENKACSKFGTGLFFLIFCQLYSLSKLILNPKRKIINTRQEFALCRETSECMSPKWLPYKSFHSLQCHTPTQHNNTTSDIALTIVAGQTNFKQESRLSSLATRVLTPSLFFVLGKHFLASSG